MTRMMYICGIFYYILNISSSSKARAGARKRCSNDTRARLRTDGFCMFMRCVYENDGLKERVRERERVTLL